MHKASPKPDKLHDETDPTSILCLRTPAGLIVPEPVNFDLALAHCDPDDPGAYLQYHIDALTAAREDANKARIAKGLPPKKYGKPYGIGASKRQRGTAEFTLE
jgi:hypothetical protein